jgi:hypothetical protein
VDQWLALAEKTFVFACSARTMFAQGDVETKRSLLAAIGSNLILKDKKLSIEAKKPFLILEKSLPCLQGKNGRIEPEICRRDKGKRAPVSTLSPTGLPQWDDVRTSGESMAWPEIVQNIWHHVQACQDECPPLLVVLGQILAAQSGSRVSTPVA